jgi:hypothetical protein
VTLNVFRKILLLLGMVSFLLGPSTAVFASTPDQMSSMVSDAHFQHSADHQDKADAMNDCGDIDCNDCDMAACPLSGSSMSFVSEVLAINLVKVRQVNAMGAPPNLADLNRQNLPLPPP